MGSFSRCEKKEEKNEWISGERCCLLEGWVVGRKQLKVGFVGKS